MFFDRGLKDNLTLRREGSGRPFWAMALLAILVVALVGAAGVLLWKHAGSARQAGKARAEERVVSGPEQRMLSEIRALISARKLIRAREQCYLALERCQDPAVISDVERLLGQINLNLLLTPEPMPEKVEYIVQGGDSLESIAKKHGTTVELIRKSNIIRGTTIHPGDRLLVFKAPLSLFVSKARNDMVLKANDVFFKRYRVGTGEYGRTPVGTFKISEKIPEPPWWRPDGKMIPFGDKENVLGTRWMSIAPVEGTPAISGYGIHGTWDDGTVGKQASAGCIRLVNSDVEELFMLVPVGTRVVITE